MVSSGVVRVAPGFCLRSLTGGMGPGELADWTEAGQGKLDCLVSKSSFNLGQLRRAVSLRGLSGELGRAVCHQGRKSCQRIHTCPSGVIQGCSKGAKRCHWVETGVPLGTQGKPLERMRVDKKMYMKETQGRLPG